MGLGTLRTRIGRVLAEMAERAPKLPWYVLDQDLHDSTLFRGPDGKEYAKADFEALQKHYQLMIIVREDGPPSDEQEG